MDVRIVEVATRLFARNGFASTSIQSVADEVGIRKQSLLYHFPSKQALREAVLDSILSHWKDVLPRVLYEATSGENRFQSALEVVVEFFAASPPRAQLIIRELLDRPSEMKELIREHLRPWLGLITDFIRTGQERGMVYREVDPESYVVLVTALSINTIAAASVLQVFFPEELPQERTFGRLVDEIQRIAKAALFLDPSRTFESPETKPDNTG